MTTSAEVWLMGDSLRTIYVGPPQTTRSLGINFLNVNGMYWLGSNAGEFAQLCLCAANPRIAGTNDSVFFYNTENRVYNNISVSNVKIWYYTSNTSISDGLNIISNLRPLTISYTEGTDNSLQKSVPSTEYTLDINSLKKLIPHSVVNLNNDEKGINYEEIIPYLKKAIEQLAEKIDSQNCKIATLQKDVYTSKQLIRQQSKTSCNNSNGEETIYYQLPENIKTAYIQLCNEKGEQITLLDIIGTSSTTLTKELLGGSDKGFYSLIENGKLIEINKITLQ